ncbi:MAG: alpha-amylase family glycosyl hydrolase, partial [Gemmataceae bacterium]
DWNDLVKAAHDRGMRILLDYVANHISDAHPAFLAARQADGSHRDWFHFDDWPSRYRGFFDLPSMPIWNTAHPDVRRHLIDHALLWLDRGCDGFRLDHANGPGPSFWAEFRARVRRQHPECVLLGEVLDPPDELRAYEGRLDGCLDFILAETLRGVFARGDLSMARIATLIDRHYRYFRPGLRLPAFLDNHDMNRFTWLARSRPGALRLAATVLFTLPGPPVLYYGTEVGLGQRAGIGRLEEARLPMPPPGQGDGFLRSFFRDLIQIRRSRDDFAGDLPVLLACDEVRQVLAYRSRGLVVVVNQGTHPVPLMGSEWSVGEMVREMVFDTRRGRLPTPEPLRDRAMLPAESACILR